MGEPLGGGPAGCAAVGGCCAALRRGLGMAATGSAGSIECARQPTSCCLPTSAHLPQQAGTLSAARWRARCWARRWTSTRVEKTCGSPTTTTSWRRSVCAVVVLCAMRCLAGRCLATPPLLSSPPAASLPAPSPPLSLTAAGGGLLPLRRLPAVGEAGGWWLGGGWAAPGQRAAAAEWSAAVDHRCCYLCDTTTTTLLPRTSGQLLPALGPPGHRGPEDEQVPQKLHHDSVS